MLLRDQPLKSYDFESIHKDELNITKVLEYIRCHYQDVTLQSLSRDLHFHQNYISRKIKDTISMSFQEFLLDVRMKEAERLLSETEMTVKDISNQLGYKKPSFLYKYFKAKHGITPKKFREYKKCF
nr:AraC family transcriptional regulator [Mobilitalea sibirica]